MCDIEFDDDYRLRYLLGAASTVNSAKKVLMEYGHIERIEDKYSVADSYLPVICEVIEFECYEICVTKNL